MAKSSEPTTKALQMHLRTTSEAAQSTSRKRQMNKGRKRGEKMVRRLSEKEEESEELCGRQWSKVNKEKGELCLFSNKKKQCEAPRSSYEYSQSVSQPTRMAPDRPAAASSASFAFNLEELCVRAVEMIRMKTCNNNKN